jgi:low temperature requirement protein LtrA
VTGKILGEIELSAATVSAFVVVLVGSAALWWPYFYRSAEAARRAICSEEPDWAGSLALPAGRTLMYIAWRNGALRGHLWRVNAYS